MRPTAHNHAISAAASTLLLSGAEFAHTETGFRVRRPGDDIELDVGDDGAADVRIGRLGTVCGSRNPVLAARLAAAIAQSPLSKRPRS